LATMLATLQAFEADGQLLEDEAIAQEVRSRQNQAIEPHGK
jgi:hypothetical protein